MNTPSFFEFVVEEFLGAPIRVRRDGSKHWRCPKCNSPAFHSLPSTDKHPKQRVRCKPTCDVRGDEHDLLKILEPRKYWDYEKRRRRRQLSLQGFS